MVAISEALFVAETLLVWVLLTVVQIPFRKEGYGKIRAVLFVLKLVLILITALLSSTVEWRLAYSYVHILYALYVALIGDTAASVAEYIIRRVRAGDDGRRRRYDHRAGAPVGLAVCVAVLAFGMVNAETVTMDSHVWQADGLAGSHTFAFAAGWERGPDLRDRALHSSKNISDLSLFLECHPSGLDSGEMWPICSNATNSVPLISGNRAS